jgi:hypothetical protein
MGCIVEIGSGISTAGLTPGTIEGSVLITVGVALLNTAVGAVGWTKGIRRLTNDTVVIETYLPITIESTEEPGDQNHSMPIILQPFIWYFNQYSTINNMKVSK